MNNKIKTALLIVAGLVIIWLLYLVLSPGKQYDSHTPQAAEVKADHDMLKVKLAASAKREDSIRFQLSLKDSAIRALQAGQRILKTKLDGTVAEAKRLANDIRSYNNDTGAYGQQMDSLVAVIDNLQFLLGQYEQNADTINTAYDRKCADYEALLRDKEAIKTELEAAYNKLYTEYQQLLKDYAGAKRSLKQERLKTKVAALLALVAGAAAVLK